jgi:hypothetical protein
MDERQNSPGQSVDYHIMTIDDLNLIARICSNHLSREINYFNKIKILNLIKIPKIAFAD